MANFKNLTLAMALIAMLSIALAVPMWKQSAYATDIRTLTIADATNQATGQAMYSGSITFFGERFTNPSNIILIEVDCAYLELRKVGSPTGTLTVGFYDTSRNLIKQFGTKDVSTLTGSYTLYSFCLDGSDSGHLIQKDTILAASYSGGDASNKVDLRRSNIGTSGVEYDGIDSYLSYYDGSWHNYNTLGNSRDLLFKLTNTFDLDAFGEIEEEFVGNNFDANACDLLEDSLASVVLVASANVRDAGRCRDVDTEWDEGRMLWGEQIDSDTYNIRNYAWYQETGNPVQEMRGLKSVIEYCEADLVFQENGEFDFEEWQCVPDSEVTSSAVFTDQDGYATFELNLVEDSGQYIIYNAFGENAWCNVEDDEFNVEPLPNSELQCGRTLADDDPWIIAGDAEHGIFIDTDTP